MEKKTIDNLGPEVSSRYAEDKKFYDATLIKDARAIPKQAEIDVTLPSYPNELDQLLETTRRHTLWAEFPLPAKFHEQKKQLFTQQVIPSLGSSDRKEALVVRIKETVAKNQGKKELAKQENRTLSWEDERELQQEEREQDTLVSLFNRVGDLERTFIDINSRRSQYHKG